MQSGETLRSVPQRRRAARLGGFVVKTRTWFTLFIVSLGTVAATVSCGSDEATGGGGGGSGGGIISAGGRAGGVGRAGSGGGTSSSPIGSSCTTDAQCGAGLK